MSFYDICCKFMADRRCAELSPLEFYRVIFPAGELQKADESHNWKYNAIAIELMPKPCKPRRFVIGDDLDELADLLRSENFVIIAPISYVGKSKSAKNARYLYALCIDLDGVDDLDHLHDLFHQILTAKVLPVPQFVACSGNGLHLYYQFDPPVPLFENVLRELTRLKNGLTRIIWNGYVTHLSDAVQYQPVVQQFRIVGGVTKDYAETGHRVRVWQVDSHPTSLEYLNSFVWDEYKMDKSAIQYKPSMMLAEAKERFPNWYACKIEGKKSGWNVKRAVYDWWKREIGAKAIVGHRYYCVMCLAIYAKKCGVSFDELKKDAYSFVKPFEAMTDKDDNHFTARDVEDALKAYDDSKKTMPINSIIHFSGIRIEKNKRNGRPQKLHLEGARAIQAVNDKFNGRNWRDGNGRKSVESVVFDFLSRFPDAKADDFVKETGLSRRVFFKYKKGWKDERDHEEFNAVWRAIFPKKA